MRLRIIAVVLAPWRHQMVTQAGIRRRTKRLIWDLPGIQVTPPH